MAKLEVGPLDEYIEQLSKFEKGEKLREVITISLYEGANIVANEIKNEIDNLSTSERWIDGVTKIEKNDLKKGFGIAPMQYKGGDYDVKIGFDGYGQTKTKKHPKGIPIPLTARSIISGSSFRSKNDFVRRAVGRVRKKSINKMNETINKKIKKEME